MERGYVNVTSGDVDALYKAAFGSGRMLKSAGGDDTGDSGGLDLSNYKDVIYGILAGGGAGLAAHAITPKDRDESLIRRMLSHVLAGAMFGGIGGYGIHRFRGIGKSAAAGLETASPSEVAYDTAGRPVGQGTGDKASIAAQVADRLPAAAVGAAVGGVAGRMRVSSARAAAADAVANASAKQLHLPSGAFPGITIRPGAESPLSVMPGVRLDASDASAAEELIGDLAEWKTKSKDPTWAKGFGDRAAINAGLTRSQADNVAREYGRISAEGAKARRRLGKWNGAVRSKGLPLLLALLGAYTGYTGYGNWQIAASRAAKERAKSKEKSEPDANGDGGQTDVQP